MRLTDLNLYTTDLTTLRLAAEGGIVRITLARPDKRNAMNPRMHEELHALLPRLNADPEVRVIVITGAGKSFCAGADIKEYFQDLQDKPELQAHYFELARHWMWESLAKSPKVTIAQINGHCFGGGILAMLACDIAIAGDEAVFGLPEINWGHIPGGAASLATIEAMGMRKALYWALTGENFEAHIAERDGLVTRTVSQSLLGTEVDRIAESLAGKSPVALETIKQIYREARSVGMEGIHPYVNGKLAEMRARDTGGLRDQGMADFLDKKLRTTS